MKHLGRLCLFLKNPPPQRDIQSQAQADYHSQTTHQPAVTLTLFLCGKKSEPKITIVIFFRLLAFHLTTKSCQTTRRA